jgi:hypothetical protein
MPLLDHFRWPRWIKGEAVPPLKLVEAPAGGRLERLVARQRIVRVPSELELRLEAMEEEYSAPLYDSSAYSSPHAAREED